MADRYVAARLTVPYKTMQRIVRLAEIYGLSKANTMLKLIEMSLIAEGEKIDTSAITPNGHRNANGIPINVINTLREKL